MFRKKLPSTILLDYIEGRGRGDEIDDYAHRHLSELEEQEVITPLLEISRKYSNSEYLIGISNPASFEEIGRLAQELKGKGL